MFSLRVSVDLYLAMYKIIHNWNELLGTFTDLCFFYDHCQTNKMNEKNALNCCNHCNPNTVYTISQGFVKGPAKKFCTQSVFRPCIWNRGCCLFVSAMIHASVCSFLILPTGYLHRALTKRKKPQDNYISVTWQQAHHTCSVNTPATCPLWRLIWSQNSQVSLHQTWHKSYSATWCHITLTCWFTLRPVLYSHQERRDI